MASKYDALSRSQIVIRLTQLEEILLHTKPGSDNNRRASKERTELFRALTAKDEAILAAWTAGWTMERRKREGI